MSRTALLLVLFSAVTLAQEPSDPVIRGILDLERYRESRIPVFLNDFAELEHFRAANATLPAPAVGENRVVFLGDSITAGWEFERYFPGKSYINRGISGQTTPQMLLRLRQDVINLRPRAVVLLAGTNDIAGNTGPMSLDDIEANYASIAELARSNGIAVVLSSVTPVNNYTPRAASLFFGRSPEKITALNQWMKDYCAKKGCVYLDYYSAMVDDKGLLQRDLAADGLHPNPAGYRIMAPLAEKAIGQALSAPGAAVTTR